MKFEANAQSLILITGGLNVPHRIPDIPEEIKKIFSQKKNKFDYILSTGSSCDRESIEWLKSLLQDQNYPKNFIDVKSEDKNSNNLKEIESIKIGDFLISICNGSQIVPWQDIETLSSLQKQTGCDILVTGFTHKPNIIYYEGKYFINPGSLSGAFSPLVNDPSPSFIILVISGDCGVIYLYELNKSTRKFEISKLDINKIKSD